MNGGKLKPGWREGVEQLKERDRLLGLAEPQGSLSGIFESSDFLDQKLDSCLQSLDRCLQRINALRKAAGLPPV